MSKKAHAKYSASGSERWINCSASIAASEKYPNIDSEAAKEGTRAHECLESFMLAWLGGKRGPGLRAIYDFLLASYPPEMVEHAWKAFVYIRGRTHKADEVIAESKVDASFFTMPGQFGTVDAAIVFLFDRLIVIDLKYGVGLPVMPEENTQAIYYALGIAKKYHFNFAEVEIVIFQPRDGHARGPIRSWVIPIQQLVSYIPMFKKAVEKCEDPFAEFNAGDWCFFCPVREHCATYRAHQLDKGQKEFDDE